MEQLLARQEAMLPTQALMFGYATGQNGGLWWGLFAAYVLAAVWFAVRNWWRL